MTRRMDRREFLTGAVALGAAGATSAALSGPLGSLFMPDASASTVPRTSAAASNRTLVMCTLYGGNDGLNTVVPYEDPKYLANRENIAIPVNQLLPLGDGLGLNPSMPTLKSFWDAGKLAIVRGVGYPDASLSHFQAMAIWQSASPSGDEATGWLGRWLDRNSNDPLRACSVGPTIPPLMAGGLHRASAVQDSTSGGAQLPSIDRELLAVYRELQRGRPGGGGNENAIATAATNMVKTSKTFANALDHEPPPVLAKGVEDGDLGTQLDIVSGLIRAGLPTRAYSVSQGGYDTHSGELGTQSRMLQQFDTAVQAFFSSIAGNPTAAGTTLVAYSEFGRRVDSNASQGTDHGTANNVYVMGPGVVGGFYGEQPSLTHLDDNGNLIYNVDFRSVYATVLEQIIGFESKPILGHSFPTLGFV